MNSNANNLNTLVEDPLVLASAGTGHGLAISKAMIEMDGGRNVDC